MESIYVILFCEKCKKTTVVLKEEADDTKKKNRYLACAHCSSKRVVTQSQTNDLRECMKHMAWKKERGAIKQVRQ